MIVSYTYPPDNTVSAMRPLRIGRAFERANWQVIILRSSFTGFSGGIDFELPKWPLFEYEPGILSRWLAFNGRAGKYSKTLKSLVRRAIFPEHTWLLKDSAKHRMDEILTSIPIDCVVTISFPFSLHVAFRELRSRWASVIWVADNRDMWAGHGGRRRHFAPKKLLESVERSVFRDCDVASFAAPSTLRAYRNRYANDGMNRSVCVMNGAEEGVASSGASPDEGPRDSIRFVHTGNLYDGRRDLLPLLRCLEIVYRTTRRRSALVLAGRDSIKISQRFGKIDGVDVEAAGQLERSASLELQGSADFLVVAMEKSPFDRSFIPAKIFEYAMRRAPVIAIADECSDLAFLVNEYSLGVCSRDANVLASFVIGASCGDWAATSRRNELTAEHQFGRMVVEVERLLASN